MQDLPNLNLDNDLLKSTITSVIENIEVWDNSLSFLFSDCLAKITDRIIDKLIANPELSSYPKSLFYNDLINQILKFYINIIENTETDITMHYIRGFNDIIETLSKYKRVIVEQGLIEKVSIMGSFGKKNTLRKYSLFFCTCLIRVIKIICKIKPYFSFKL